MHKQETGPDVRSVCGRPVGRGSPALGPGQTVEYACVPVTGRGPGRTWGQVCFGTKIGISATCPGSETQHGLQCAILALNYQIHTTQSTAALAVTGSAAPDSPPPGARCTPAAAWQGGFSEHCDPNSAETGWTTWALDTAEGAPGSGKDPAAEEYLGVSGHPGPSPGLHTERG